MFSNRSCRVLCLVIAVLLTFVAAPASAIPVESAALAPLQTVFADDFDAARSGLSEFARYPAPDFADGGTEVLREAVEAAGASAVFSEPPPALLAETVASAVPVDVARGYVKVRSVAPADGTDVMVVDLYRRTDGRSVVVTLVSLETGAATPLAAVDATDSPDGQRTFVSTNYATGDVETYSTEMAGPVEEICSAGCTVENAILSLAAYVVCSLVPGGVGIACSSLGLAAGTIHGIVCGNNYQQCVNNLFTAVLERRTVTQPQVQCFSVSTCDIHVYTAKPGSYPKSSTGQVWWVRSTPYAFSITDHTFTRYRYAPTTGGYEFARLDTRATVSPTGWGPCADHIRVFQHIDWWDGSYTKLEYISPKPFLNCTY